MASRHSHWPATFVLALAACMLAVTLAPSPSRAQCAQDGVAATTAIGSQLFPLNVSDGAGGSIIVWIDQRSGSGSDIYAQRLDVEGVEQWDSDGTLVCGASGNQRDLAVLEDGSGGVFIVWTDERGADADIYAQHLDASGNALWTAGGLAVNTASGNQGAPAIDVRDDGIFVVIAWHDRRGVDNDIYAEQVDVATGALGWGGAIVSGAASEQRSPTVVYGDVSGPAWIIAWEDKRNGDYDIYSQTMSAGLPLHPSDVVVCDALKDQTRPIAISDGSGNAIIAWQDRRFDREDADRNLYAQRVSPASATALWASVEDVAKLHWLTSDGKVKRANLGGTGVEEVVAFDPAHTYTRIAFDFSAGQMYLAKKIPGGDGKIQRMNLEGTVVEDLVIDPLSNPTCIALAPAAGKMYWGDTDSHRIVRANLDGTGVEELVTAIDPVDIALDLGIGKMYWTDPTAGKIQRANLDGTDIEDLVSASALSIALDLSVNRMYWGVPTSPSERRR